LSGKQHQNGRHCHGLTIVQAAWLREETFNGNRDGWIFGREIRSVAPNSPSEMVKANVAAASVARRRMGKSMFFQTSNGDAPSDDAAWRNRCGMEAMAGCKCTDDKRQRNKRVRKWDQQRRSQPGTERDDETEPQHDSR
jgi:hypothetical protein